MKKYLLIPLMLLGLGATASANAYTVYESGNRVVYRTSGCGFGCGYNRCGYNRCYRTCTPCQRCVRYVAPRCNSCSSWWW